jgi:tripartite-type tricarboxylate transporter receptor subunit TctC
VLQFIRSGQLRALAVTTAQRSSELPDVPTLAESGLAGFDTSAWFALLAPKQTPTNVRAAIEAATIAALNDADAKARLRAAGIEVAGDGSAALARRIKDELAGWREVITRAQIKVE